MKDTKYMLIGVPHSQGEHLFAGHLFSTETELLCRDSREGGSWSINC